MKKALISITRQRTRRHQKLDHHTPEQSEDDMRKSFRCLAASLTQFPFRQILFAAAVVVAFGQITGCNRPSESTSPSNQPKTAGTESAVRIVRPTRKTVRYPIEQPGFNIQAFQETPLFAKIAGFIRKWNADIGDPVHKDDILAILYVPEMDVEVSQKQAAVRQSAAQIEQAKATVLTARAQLERSKSQFERLTRVGKSGVLDQDSIDETRLGYEAAKAGLLKAKADVAAAEAQLEVAKANRDYAQTMLSYTEIRAPYDGVVTRQNVNIGDFVQPAAGGMKGQALFVVNQIDPVRVFVNVPGSDAPWIKDGDPVTLQLQGAGGEIIKGKVTRNARSLNPQTRTLSTEVDLPNPQGKLLPGMYVQASITVQHENVWTLPASAIMSEGEKTFCYRIEDGKAVRTPLQIGLKGNGSVEVLMKQSRVSLSGDEQQWSPITGQEEIVGTNIASMHDGQPVQLSKSDKKSGAD
jgi:RND family efflux transporter MFP subunit